jgi:hypothetical protein
LPWNPDSAYDIKTLLHNHHKAGDLLRGILEIGIQCDHYKAIGLGKTGHQRCMLAIIPVQGNSGYPAWIGSRGMPYNFN